MTTLSRPLVLTLSLALLTAGARLPGQGETKTEAKPRLGPRSFFPKEYTREVFLDVDALQDTTVWDALERSALAGPMRLQFRKEYGFRINDIKTVRFAGRHIGGDEKSEAGKRDVSVTVIEGKTVCLPPIRKKEEFAWIELTKEKIAGYDVVREAATGEFSWFPEARLYVMPRPGCLVIGSDEMIRSVLVGKRRGGVISSRLMALTAMRKPLGYVAMGFPPPSDPRYYKEIGFDSNWLDEDDPLQHLIARMAYDDETEEFAIKATLRFKTGKKGPARLEESAKASIEAMKAQKIYPLVKEYFGKIQWKRDGEDLHVTVKIKPGELTGLFGTGGLVTYFLMAMPVRAMAPGAPVPVAAPAAEKPKTVEKDEPAKKPKKTPNAKPTSRPESKKKKGP